uniref:Uncharacterized protein n=1 Tax=viral metagenome TaxID=1070528 RepID=A0A6M3IW36_9ZZZZ
MSDVITYPTDLLELWIKKLTKLREECGLKDRKRISFEIAEVEKVLLERNKFKRMEGPEPLQKPYL